jgi:RHS repeat-associated protein
MAAGTPEGVQILSAHETVNLYSGNLSFVVPIYHVGGRGSAGYTMVLPLGTKWTIQNRPDGGNNIFVPVASVYPYEMLWPNGAGPNMFSPGRIFARSTVDPGQSNYKCTANTGPGAGYTFFQAQTLTKVTWVEADGTEHNFLDTANGGAPMPAQTPTYACTTNPNTGGPNRGRIFEATDASGDTFVADNTIYDAITTTTKPALDQKGLAGWLFLKDGTRYYADSSGDITNIIDRTGNETTVTVGLVTDSLGRQITIGSANLTTLPSTQTITYPGAYGPTSATTHSITITYKALSAALISGAYVESYGALFPIASGTWPTNCATQFAQDGSACFNPAVVSSITLPDNSSYSFLYNAYGELAQATLPSGGVYQYDYPGAMPANSPTACSGGQCVIGYTQDDATTGGTQEYMVQRRVLARRVYPNGISNGMEGQQCYSDAGSGGAAVAVNYYGATAEPSCTAGTLISQETHTFTSSFLDYAGGGPPIFNESALEGKETSTQCLDASGTVRKTTNTLWEVAASFQNQNAVECQSNLTLGGSSSSSGTFSLYDQYSNVTDVYEFDFGAAPAIGTSCPTSAPAGWTRQRHNTYVTNGYDTIAASPTVGSATDANSDHIRNLVQESDVYQSGGTLAAKTTFAYDAPSVTPQSSPTGYITPGHPHLGNRTSQTTFPSVSGTGLTTTYAYDNLGNVLTITDPNGNPLTISYANNCSASPGGNLYAFPTTVTNALNQFAGIAWDCYIGKQTTYTDLNGVITDYVYNSPSVDPYDRLLLVKRAVGKLEETHIAFSYPNLTTVTTKQDQSSLNDGAIATTSLYDGTLRKVSTQRSLGSGCGITVQQIYDGKGRAYQTSLPYNTCTGEVEHFVTTLYDGANRPISVATDDLSATTTTYSGNQSTVTDAASASRTITTDGLGRLTSVIETITPTSYTTSYTYDVLDDLLTVTQGALSQRTFTYDAMKRQVTATNPENGRICYGTLSGTTCTENYDNNGNLLSRVDSAGVATSYSYDKLNRMFTKSYSDGTTPPVTFAYDGTGSGACATSSSSYNIGRPTSVSTQALGSAPATQQLTSYDALGRACSSSETVASSGPYSFTYQYNLASGLKTEGYPSGRVVTTRSFDLLNRPTGLGSTLGPYASTYVASAGYASNDALNGLTLGPSTTTPLGTQSITFDPVRQQPTLITVANPSATQLTLQYFYCPSSGTSCSTNNGNVQSAGIVVPSPNALNLTQTFGYDTVNRLTIAQETGGTDEWNQAYGYDQWGNRAVSGNYIPNTYATPSSLSQYTNNQWLGTGASYDSKGNQKSLPLRTFTYDAENRLVASTQPGMGAISYVYDGDGRRVQKTVAPAVTTYVYDAGGQLTAEYSTAAPAASGTEYLMADALGSTRVVLDATGSVKERIDYLPFGEEIATPIGGRASPYTTGLYPSNPDIEAQKFTAKERDTETGLDFFGARYFSGPQGRFTSPDPSNLSVDFWLPQTWNRYSYVLNNPLNMADRNGLWPFYIHNEIINEAFPGMSKQDLQILKEASARMDTRPGQQTGGQAPQHGMSNGSSGQTTAQAQQQGDAFIAEQEDLARQIQADWLASGQSGISPYALMAFGNALHTIEDRLSPAHIGSQPWYGQSAWSPSAWAHFLHESYITSFQMGLATSAAQRAFRNTFGFDAFTLMQLQQQQPPPPPKPTVTTKICYTLDNGTQVCQGQ